MTFIVARRLGKPCKYTETRSESLMAAHHGRDQWQKLTLAATKDGTVTGLKVDLLADLGAYVALVGGGVPVLGAFMFNAIYKFPAYQFNCTTLLTNKTWTDAYRGAGRPEATYAIERLMDELAVEVGVDPLEIREKNWIKHEEFPSRPSAVWSTTRATTRRRPRRRRPVSGTTSCVRSRGNVATRTTRSSSVSASPRSPRCAAWLHPGSWAASTTEPVAGSTPPCGCCRPARSRSSPARRLTARGTRPPGRRSSPTGSASPSTTSRCCTATRRSRPEGMDTYGSRSLTVGGEALVRAADKVIEKAKVIAAHLLEASEADLEFDSGTFTVKGTDKGAVDPGGLAGDLRRTQHAGRRRAVLGLATRRSTRSASPSRTAPTCVPWRSTPRPARVKMRKYVAVDDIGVIVNPLIVAGQVHGGLMQGIAQALFEEAVHDESGTLVTASFVDYTLPTAADTISFDIDHTTSPSTTNSLGTKGVGEAGTIASTPAVVNAVVDAIRHFGVNDIVMPCTPERVYRAIHDAGSRGGAKPTEAESQPHFDESEGESQ